MDPVSEEEVGRSLDTSSTSTLSVGIGDVSTTAEEDEEVPQPNRQPTSNNSSTSEFIVNESLSSENDIDGMIDDLDDEDEEEMRIEDFQRNFDILDSAIADMYVEKNKLDIYLTWLPWVDSIKATKDHVRVFYNEILPRTIKLILSRRYDPNRASMMNLFLLTLAKKAVSYAASIDPKSISPSMIDSFIFLTAPLSPFYLAHGREQNQSTSVGPSPSPTNSNNLLVKSVRFLSKQEVEKLTVGSLVHLAELEVSGKIVEESPTETEVLVEVEDGRRKWLPKEAGYFLADRPNGDDDQIDQESDEAAEARMKAEKPRFRAELEAGNYVDIRKDGKWYQGCVIDFDAPDNFRVHVLGFQLSQDVIVTRTSPDLAPLNVMSRGRRGPEFVKTDFIDREEFDTCVSYGTEEPILQNEVSFKYVRSRSDHPCSSYFISNCEVLLDEGLLKIIWNCLSTNLRMCFSCIYQLAPYFTEMFLQQAVHNINARTMECVQNMTQDQVRNLTNVVVDKIVAGTYKMVRRCLSRLTACQYAEFLRLELARKRIESEAIMQRVNGLVTLVEMIDESCAWRRGRWGFEYHRDEDREYYSRVKITSSITPPMLAKWCHDKKFLHGIFAGPNAHCELMKRAPRLVTFLCEEGLFDETDFELIWQASRSDDTEAMNAGLAVLGATCRFFPEDARKMFMSKLRDLDFSRTTTLGLLKDLIWQGAPDIARSASDLLFQQAMDLDSEPACAALEASLGMDHPNSLWWTDFRKDIMTRTIQKNGLRQLNSLRLLRAAIESFGTGRVSVDVQKPTTQGEGESTTSAVMTRREIMEWVCSELKLKEILLGSLTSAEKELSDADVQMRLDFLSFILSNSEPSVLTLETIETLWNKFPPATSSRDVFFTWLQRICRVSTIVPQSKRDITIPGDVLFALFDKVQEKPEFQSLTGFRLFQALFVGINLAVGKFSNSEVPSEGVRVCDENFLGAETLWKAALEAESSDQVAETAAGLLSFFHQRLSASIVGKIWKIRANAVQVCRERMVKAIAQGSFVVLSRCCAFLRFVLRDSESEFARMIRSSPTDPDIWSRIRPHSSLGPYPPQSNITVQNTIKGSPNYNTRYQIQLRANDPMGKLRGFIARQCHVDEVTDVRLFVGGTEVSLKFDARTLVSCMSQSPHVLACKRLGDRPQMYPLIQQSMDDIDEDWLGSCAEFLLSAMEQAVEKPSQESQAWLTEAWHLLDLLPTSRSFLSSSVDSDGFGEEHAEASSPTQDYLSPGTSPFRTVYNFRIIQDLLYGFEIKQELSQYVVSRNLFTRLQRLLHHLASEVDQTSEKAMATHEWIATSIGMTLGMMGDLLVGLDFDARQNTLGTLEPMTTRTVSMSSSLSSRSSGGGWPSAQLSLDGIASEMVLACLDAQEIQRTLLMKIIPFLVKTCLQKSSSGGIEEEEEDDQRSNQRRRELRGYISRAFEVWSQVLMLEPSAARWIQAQEKEANGSNEDNAELAFHQGLKWLVMNCDESVARGLGDLFLRFPTNPLLSFCIQVLPSDRQSLLELTATILSRAVTTNTMNADKLMETLTTKLRALSPKEGRPFPRGHPYVDAPDVHVNGLIHLIRILVPHVSTFPVRCLETIGDCVFQLHECKCERATSRQNVYDVLLAICEAFPSEADHFIAQRLESCFELRDNGEVRDSAAILADQGWNLDPCADLRSPLGLCGLVNLGCTCYINSLVQQLWNIPRIRNGFRLLRLPPPPPPPSKSDGTAGRRGSFLSNLSGAERRKEEDLHSLRLLQSCMSHLSCSTRRAFTLEKFVKSFKDEFGNTTNVLEQQDAQEFFEKTCDRLDDAMRNQQNEALFKSTLGVQVASALICLDDPAQQRREDAGTMEWALKVELTPGGGTLKQSLDDFVSGEILTDFRWQDNGPSMRTMKKTYVTSLADTLTVHIKRFQLNWETQLTEKNNDRLEFPLELDMFPYTKEGLDYEERMKAVTTSSNNQEDKYSIEGRPKEYYRYRLVGILVHSGASLNAGHYYSHILSRFPGPTEGKWFTFNDTSVSTFDLADLADQTFGGVMKQTVVHPETKVMQDVESVITHNAYMLFYEREKPFADTLERPSPEQIPQVEEVVLRENLEHLVACRWLDPALLQFILSRCSLQSAASSVAAVQVPSVSEMGDRKRKQVDAQLVPDVLGKKSLLIGNKVTETLVTCIFKHFLIGPAVAARSSSCSSIYPNLSDAIRRDLTEERANRLLKLVSVKDLEVMLLECGDLRTRLAFSTLLSSLCVAASVEEAERFLEQKLITPRMFDAAMSQADNSYWFALRNVLDLSEPLALKAFKIGMVPEILNAALGHESPVSEYSRASSISFLPYSKRPVGTPPPPPPSSAYARNGWDNAIVAAATAVCAGLDSLPRPGADSPVDVQVLGDLDVVSMMCAQSMTAWVQCIGCIALTDTTEKIYSVLFRGLMRQMENELNLALKLAKIASTASFDSIGRFYDVVYQLGIDSSEFPVVFFLGEDEDQKTGFLCRVVTNRSSMFAFGCVTNFVERLDDFPQMKSPEILDRWVPNVDSFLRDDSLTGTLEPREINRVLSVLETLANLGMQSVPPRAASSMDCDTASSVTQPANGWHTDEEDDDLYSPGPRGQGEDV